MNYKPLFRASEDSFKPGDLMAQLLEMQNRERLLAAVVEHTPECVKLITSEGILLDMNSAGLCLIEADCFEQVKGANVYDLIAPEHLESFQAFNERVCSGRKESLVFEIIALKGCRRWMSTTAVPLDLPDGETVHLAITREITDEVLRKEELKAAKEKAEAANRAKSEFLANMSHEIRTPMTAILGFSDILLDSETKEENVAAARTIKENGRFLLGLINDILDLSKIEAGKLEVEMIRCSPHKILSDVASLMQVRASAKGLPLNFVFAGEIPEFIESDPTRIRQVLINIVGNAIKFTETGSVDITTRFQLRGNEPQLQIEVTDTGIGIDCSKIDSLFSPFTQADSSTTRNFGGTGLGLAICKRLSEALGGDIAVKSEVNKGSTFVVTFATGSISGVRMLNEHTEAFQGSIEKQEGSDSNLLIPDARILLVEDGPDNQRLIKYLLKKVGANVLTAENGQVAIDMIQVASKSENSFDVILMDMQMPVLDGYAATKILREQDYQGPIIALTAHAMSGDRTKCLEAGCDDYTTKPVNREELISIVSKYVRKNCALGQ